MKHMSIKKKITLWYTVFMNLFVLLALSLLLFIVNGRILSDARLRLKDTVTRSYHEIEYEDGLLKFDDDLNYLGEGIYLSVYDNGGALVYGRIPSTFSGAATLIMDELRQVRSRDTVWYVYDYCQNIEGYGNLWVRGIVSQSRTDAVLRTLVLFSLVLFPFFVLCIALGGYSIIKKALQPLTSMAETAKQIGSGSDLSRRIRLSPGEDEVHRLADTFDGMMDRLEASFEAEKQFTSDVSHELRTPISVILSQCEYASGESVSMEEQREALESISSQAKKMNGLISQLLTLARAESRKTALHLETVNVSELAEMVCEEQEFAAKDKQIAIHTQLPPNLLMRGDETMLIRLFINLLSNSISYGKRGGNIWVELHQEDGLIKGSVADDGIGIPKDQLDQIWGRFYQVDPARSSSGKEVSGCGFGLGLPMVKWIVQAHDGSISVESCPEEGARFSFQFPSGL